MKRTRKFVGMKRIPRKPPAEGLVGFDLTKLALTDLDAVSVDFEEKTVEVTYTIPTGRHEDYATFTDSFDLSHDGDAPGYVIGALRGLTAALVRASGERAKYDTEVPCVTCKSSCCGIGFDEVAVTGQDYARMQEAGLSVETTVELFSQEDPTGHVGSLKLVPWFGDPERHACVFLKPDGCSIYETRPLICREFSPWTCDLYEKDEDKASGKHRLRVVR